MSSAPEVVPGHSATESGGLPAKFDKLSVPKFYKQEEGEREEREESKQQVALSTVRTEHKYPKSATSD